MSYLDLEDYRSSLFECFRKQAKAHIAARKKCTGILTNFSRISIDRPYVHTVAVSFKAFSTTLTRKLFQSGVPSAVGQIFQSRVTVVGFILILSLVLTSPGHTAYVSSLEGEPIIKKNIEMSRDRAATSPNKETDQVLIDGWPLYRTLRGQVAFNQAMATLRATETASPNIDAFKNCKELRCRLVLPKLRPNGWIPAGRLWISPSTYVLIAHSPRIKRQEQYRRRPKKKMRIFVFHEFHNSTGNTDLYDTISSHRRSVFVPFYMSKPKIDPKGRRFVIVMQVAPHDVVSRHAFNLGNLGPGIEIAKNKWEKLAPLQAKAGILIANIIKVAEPQIRIVRHRNTEGLPSLRAYQRRLAALKKKTRTTKVVLPFTPASSRDVANATGSLKELITEKYLTAIPIATRVERPSPKFVPVPRRVTAPQSQFSSRLPPLTMDVLLRQILSEPTMP